MSTAHPNLVLEPDLNRVTKNDNIKVVPSSRKNQKNRILKSGREQRGNTSSYYVEDERETPRETPREPPRGTPEERSTKRKGDHLRRLEDKTEKVDAPVADCMEQRESSDYHNDQYDEIYHQRSSSSPYQDKNFSYIAGVMYPPPPAGGNPSSWYFSCCSRYGTFLGVSTKGPTCRPRFWKFLLLVVVLLMMAQFSLNMLFYKNYDSLFYVNVTAPESLASFESRVRWVSSKLPWVYSTAEEQATVTPLHTPTSKFSKVRSPPSEKVPDEGGGKELTKTAKVAPSKIPKISGQETIKNSSIVPVENNTTLQGKDSKRVLLSKEKALCPPVPPNLVGAVKVNRDVPTLEEQERSHPELEPGGRFRPAECRARHRVAIIVPYRDRAKHLAMFIYHMHPILQRQQVDYAIYIVEQAGNGKFNRAMLLNVGALEALKQYQYDCFVFHDVDLLQEDDRNLYACPEQPRHMSIAIDSMGYKLPYNDIFGGVSAMTVEQFRTVNGFSNKFWGWGGEDDDMSNRIKFHGYFISRYPANIGRYSMVSHKKEEPNPKRYQYLYDGRKRFKSDGLNSAKYKALDVQFRRLYTWIYVELYPS